MPTNKKSHLQYRYGICLNENCSKCKSKEVQQIPARKDFVCEECGKALRECPPPRSFWDKYGKIIIGVVVAAVVGILIWLLIPQFSGKGGSKVTDSDSIDTAVITPPIVEPGDDTVGTDSASVVKVPEPEDTVKAPEKDPKVKDTGKDPKGKTSGYDPKPVTEGPTVPFGRYSGPANGLNGEIMVTRSYRLELRNASHDYIDLEPGDMITKTKFRNGELVGGYWRRGTQGQSFNR